MFFRNRTLALILALLFAVLAIAPDAEAKRHNRTRGKGKVVSTATGTKDPRYADIVMNPVTGEVYHSQDADERRYPASLTKMMTLYLLFEALEQKKTTLDARLDISEYATTMPQTNLALSAGDSIPVETCIKALVVRSANDVAVVVAEALGGDTDRFAQMMTAKARQLGMRNTVFKNPNGLPNGGQYTTARDMAKLGIALKRDFPRYYKYFSTLQFSHDGVTYYTHNRVMLRYAGVDGIKTGFIGLSGFNLVTSVTRGGRPLVATVMGGGTGAWRDNRMIQLLDQTYGVLASRGAARGKMYPANLPLGKAGKTAGIEQSSVPAEDATELANLQNIPDGTGAEDGAPEDSSALPAAMMPENRDEVRAEAPAAPAAPVPAAQQAQQLAAQTPPAQVQVAAAPQPQPLTQSPRPANSVIKQPIVKAPTVVTPKPTQTPSRSRVIEVKQATAPTALPAPATAPAKPPETMVMAQQPAAQPAPAPAAAPVVAPAAPAPSPFSLAEGKAAGTGAAGWGIQVGAFSTHALAEQSAKSALQLAPKQLATARMAVADPAAGGAPVYRARLESLTQLQARKACEALISNNSPCFIYKVAP